MTETENSGSLTLELLRQLRNELTAFRRETREGLNRVEIQLGVLEQSMASILALSDADRDELRALKRRVERIEHRLELAVIMTVRTAANDKGLGHGEIMPEALPPGRQYHAPEPAPRGYHRRGSWRGARCALTQRIPPAVDFR